MIAEDKESASKKAEIRTLVFIFALAASFLVWGFLLFHTIGDKGPPPWDFGIVRDIPGESAYSTHRPLPGKVSEPDPQHVSGRPRAVEGEEKKEGNK
jgi:hypothetical protein